MSHWANQYVGIPFLDHGRDRSGIDCWGLVRLAYQEVLGVELPSYQGEYVSADERGEVARAIGRESSTPAWRPVTAGLRPLDVLVFRWGRHASHVGLWVRQGTMLHIAEEDCAKVERYDDPRWERRLVGAFRHAR